MEEKSLDTAMDIYSILATGRVISSKDKETAKYYDAFYRDSEVYEIVVQLLNKLNLKLYEHKDGLFVTAGSGNRVFGYTNDDLKKMLGLRLNRELFLVYFITYEALTFFYKTSDAYQVRDYVRLDEIMEKTGKDLKAMMKDRIYTESETGEDDDKASSFGQIAYLWESLPPMINEDKDRNKASRGSQMGYVKMTFNFLGEQKLFTNVDDRFYPSDRLGAMAENYFEDYRSRIYQALEGENA